MQASDYLRMKFQNDRRLALTTQNAVGGVLQSARGVASDIYSGMERASWYSSCFIPQYNDVCQDLKTEEIRTLYSIESIYRYRDVIAYMLYLYFKMISDDVDEGNPEGSARQLIRKMSAIASHMNIAGGTSTLLLPRLLLRCLSLVSCLKSLLNVYLQSYHKQYSCFSFSAFNKSVRLLPVI